MQTTDPSRRRYKVATLVGLISGIIGAIAKFGWEIPLPPRTAARDATNPPQAVLELFGISPSITHATYSYSGSDRPYVSFIIHFGFSIVFAIIYAVIAEKYPKIKLGQGTVFGVAVWIAFHIILMPLMGVVPAPWHQPFAEHFSELFGHAFWMWVIELTRRDLRNRITHQPDAEVDAVPVVAPAAA